MIGCIVRSLHAEAQLSLKPIAEIRELRASDRIAFTLRLLRSPTDKRNRRRNLKALIDCRCIRLRTVAIVACVARGVKAPKLVSEEGIPFGSHKSSSVQTSLHAEVVQQIRTVIVVLSSSSYCAMRQHRS